MVCPRWVKKQTMNILLFSCEDPPQESRGNGILVPLLLPVLSCQTAHFLGTPPATWHGGDAGNSYPWPSDREQLSSSMLILFFHLTVKKMAPVCVSPASKHSHICFTAGGRLEDAGWVMSLDLTSHHSTRWLTISLKGISCLLTP